ncbi:DUF1932 domain-containing protein [Pseudomonas sp. NY15364]|uniref:NAD(P)-dependent oxidoreductase n=1 Tax=Pseudomonas sp. NY15364 TaxID=3400353 RepID=UPI003A8C3AEF
MSIQRVGLIGLGEAGSIIAADLRGRGLDVQVYDRLIETAPGQCLMLQRAEQCDVRLCSSAAKACADTDLLISAVTAGQALSVAAQLAPEMRASQFYLDINSVAPATKQEAARLIEAGGASYVDAAVMAPIPPKRLATPMLLGGAQAVALSAALNHLGFHTRAVASAVGTAAAIKMCRSVMIKGLEALTAECLASARHYGAEEEVLASLQQSFPSMGWDGVLPDYLISRIAEHGRRRAEEMEEAAQTLIDANLSADLSQAIARSQRALADTMRLKRLDYAEMQPFAWRELFARLYG